MLALRIEFLAGRYYATPWGRSVNEGNPEWPPAPFRLLRALLSVWYKAGCPEQEIFNGLLANLSEPPAFSVPPSVSSHVRHYMPGFKEDEKSKVFNSFTAPQGPLFIIWDSIQLDQAQESLLSGLLRQLDYLGRSESWVEAKLDRSPPPANLAVAEPGLEPDIPLLCAIRPGEWFGLHPRIREDETNRILQKKKADGKKPVLTKKEREVVEAITPEVYREALAVETGVLRENGWLFPPAARRIGYRWIGGEPTSKKRTRRRQARQTVTLARYLLSSEVLPSYTELVPIAERARKILMGIVGARNDGVIPQELSGRTPEGTPLTTRHQHMSFIPEPDRNSRMVTHLNLYCPAGFPEVVRDNLPRLEKIWGSSGHDIRLILLTTGTPDTIGGFGKDQSFPMATAREWISLSPFIPSRHLKVKRSEMHDPWTYTEAIDREIDKVVRQELAFHDLPEPESVQLIPPYPGLGYGIFLKDHFTSWLDFRTTRLMGEGCKGSRSPYGIRIVFPEAVTGPITLGYACHYGLGLFQPVQGR